MPYFGIPIRNGLPIGLGSVAGFGVQQFSPADLFSAGEQGAWYDPSDLTTLFDDSAGTTPVTAPGNGANVWVGLMLDKSGRGNHATSTGTKRPKLAARYNLLTYSEQFDNGYWSKDNVTFTANTNATTDPLGGNTADLITENASTALHRLSRSNAATIAASCKVSLSFKAGTARYVYLEAYSGTPIGSLAVDLSDGSRITLTDTPMAPTYAIINQGNGWWKLEVTFTAVGANTGLFFGTASGPGGTRQTTGSQTFYLWGADLRPASQATGLIGPTYQRVVDAATYDTAGFLPYLVADGVDDAMNTGNIVPGADKAQVFVGLRKLTDAAQGIVAEFSATIASNNGTLLLAAPDGATQTYGFDSKGTAQVDAVASSLAAPRTNVVTGLADIAGDSCVIRVNGAVADTETGDQGTGDYLTYPLYLFGRGGTSVYFNGWMYGLIIRFGPNLSTSQIEATESWVNGKTGAY